MRHLRPALLSFGLLPGLLVLPTVTPPSPDPKPVAPEVTTLAVDGVDREALREIAAERESRRPAEVLGGEVVVSGTPTPADPEPEALLSAPVVDDFSVMGVTWDAGSVPAGDVIVQVRVRQDGSWTAWTALPVMDEGPDAGTAEFSAAKPRAGTAPLISAGAEGVQVRVDGAEGEAPQDLQVELVDPGTSRADDTVSNLALPPASAEAAAGAPRVITREQWGADESLTSGTPRVNQMVKSVVVHHTAGSNSYSAAEAVREIRGIYAYHTKSLGWADIGYNLLVDRFGNVYEGRRGSITAAVQGAHAGGFNKDTYGIAVMGNFDVARPPAAAVSALGRAVGWKLGQYGLGAYDTNRLVSAGGGTSKFSAGTVVTVNAVAAHRDVGNTACPGRYLFSQLSSVRSIAASVAASVPTTLRQAHHRDWTGDGLPDVLAPNPSGRLWLYPGTGTGGFASPQLIGRGWGLRDMVTQVGDWDGDGHPDLLGREQSTGHLWLYRGNGAGGFAGSRSIGGNWRNIDAVLGVGDWDGDGAMDVLARRVDNRTLWLYPGNGSGGWRTPTEVGSDFGAFDALVAAGDWGGTGRPALLAREAESGNLLWLERGNDGRMRTVAQIGRGWSGMTAVHGPGDWNGSGGNDLLSRTSDGRLILYSASGGEFTGSRQVGHGWSAMRIFG